MSAGTTGQPDRSAYAGFGGRVGRTISESVPSWPADRRPPAGTPNVVVVLVDDLGFSDVGPYGSEIATPNLDALAAAGVVATGYHTTPLCSPSRAALLTGVNPHRAGFAYPANSDPGYPAYTFELPDDTPTLAESLRDAGFATFMVGKWHLTGDRSLHDGADKSSWPVQRGFDRYFGSLEGFTSLHAPHRLVWDNSPYPTPDFADDYYLTDDLTDRAVEMIRSLRASDATKPFLLYFAHHAVHGPVQAKASDLDTYAGAYDAGWDEVRRRRFQRQRELGLFDESTTLPGPETDPAHAVPPWSSLTAEEQQRFARYMEVYAGAVDAVDQSLGRVVDVLREHDELDNTIVVFTSDNGGTAEGGPRGTRSYFSQFAHVAGLPTDWDRDVERPLELIGGPQTTVHYPRGWGEVSNTPFRLHKGSAYAGGIRAPLIVSWPAGGLLGGGRRHQYLHVTDLTPTLLELAGVARAARRHGLDASAVDGVSAAALLRDPDAPAVHGAQLTESGGQRAYQDGRWKIVTDHRPGAAFDDAEWRLYDVESDPTEIHDIAATEPGVLADLAAAWEAAAWRNRVFPLDDHGPASSLRRPEDARLSEPVTLVPGTPTLERFRSAQLVAHRSFTVRIDLDVERGDEGVLVAHGDQGGGYQVRVGSAVDGPYALVVVNAYGRLVRSEPLPLAPGPRTLTLEVTARQDFRSDWALTDGTEEVRLDDLPQLLGMAPFTGISVGADHGGPVDWDVHVRHRNHPYSGVLRTVRYEPGPLTPDAPAERARVWAEGASIYD